ncbi:MAG: hypothetical protein CMA27_03740 [Euryarchaeota archaeon]|nr:hypothetical protein [Euryarchaeota archaeon]
MEKKSEDDESQGPFEPIAIIGMSCILPDSPNVDELWKNIQSKHVSFKEIPEDRWEVNDFFNEEKTLNKTYSKIGAFVEGYEFDWKRWRQPPGTLPQIDICQQWAVSVSASALENAGYLGEGKVEPPRGKTSVIFANALGGENRNLSNQRVWAGRTLRLAKESGLQDEETFMEEITKGLPKIDEDTMPGELANVVAGRVANLLDLQGPNYTTDAACASSMAAILDACRLLQLRQVDMAIAGASDRTMDPATYAKFSAIGALSATHSTPFDSRANGFVMGEGAGAIVLKRLVDAIADGDEIHSVIRGIGASSDGRGKGITAPSKRGQAQAVNRAYSQAGYSIDTVGLIEAHGTSTRVGDATELGTLNDIFEGLPSGENVAVGSIKSQIGHLKAAAGIAGVLKATLALSKKIIPPSAGFKTPNETVDWDKNPFFVPMESMKWNSNSETPLRAGISAFGFGGTNFHIALESYDEAHHRDISNEWSQRWLAYTGELIPQNNMAIGDINLEKIEPSLTWNQLKEIEGGVLLINAPDVKEIKHKIEKIKSELSAIESNFDNSPDGVRLSEKLTSLSENFECKDLRVAIVATDWEGIFKKLDLVFENIDDENKWGFLGSQDVFITSEEISEEDKIAHLFPGQGSQYVGMTYDLSLRYGIIGDTWDEADKTMMEILDGQKLSEFVLSSNLSKEERIAAELKLKQTEYTQPAMLTADLALHRLLEQHGQVPDMVAGHSLGEYAALMVSGILQFHDALRAAAARGTEMGSVDVPDKGLMASITAPYDKIEDILYDLEGYVIPANKNSPLMTVIAGETEGVNSAIEKFEELGINCVLLPTSHAFHTRIVAPANEPLKRFLENLEINLPEIPITSNYDGEYYPSNCEEGFSIKETILPQLAPQMSSPVEWTRQIENMYDDGAKIFVEVGPKRALTMFCGQILEENEHNSIMTNHPKQGGIRSFLCSLGQLAILGQNIILPQLNDELHTIAFSSGPIEASRKIEKPAVVISAPLNVTKTENINSQEVITQMPIEDWVASICSEYCGYPSSVCKGNVSLVDGLKMTNESISELKEKISGQAKCKQSLFDAKSISELVESIEELPASAVKIKKLKLESKERIVGQFSVEDGRKTDAFSVSGISLGLPGLDQVFESDTFERIISGENFISELPEEYKQRLLDKNLVRIVKDSSGNSELVPCETFDMIPQLAGIGGYFDLAEQYGIDSKITSAMDITTKLAFASGLEALRDAGIPLVANEQVSSNGKRLVRGWKLPDSEQEGTGVIFASVFPGYEELLKHAANNGADENGTFDRRFLLQILSMGHSQFAQWIGAKGPNTAINNACASTPAAFSIAEDWITTGRASRVIIVSADNTTSDVLLEWIGAGFAGAGAHSIGNVVEEVSLPFDVRRNGMLLGMGAAAFVIEKESSSRERGVTPYCELLGSHIGNSAFHPTRLDVEHVSYSFDKFITNMENIWNFNRAEIAPKTTFMSHEPATPPRGGSAAAEINALRKAFGNSAENIVITNTKGFTGHPMGTGIEDAVIIYGLATGRLPPIANFKEPDPELGNLRLSEGGEYDIEYALRHAAGFGSQMALTLFKRIARTTNRIKQKSVKSWIENITGDNIELRIFERKLVGWRNPDENIIGGIQGEVWEIPEFDAEAELISKTHEEISITKVSEKQAPLKEISEVKELKEKSSPKIIVDEEISKKVLETVVEHTGYPADFIEFDQDLEGELGVDSVKQAEIMADLRSYFELPIDDEFVLSEYPTLNHMMAYIAGMEIEENIVTNEVEIEKEVSEERILQVNNPIISEDLEVNDEIKNAVLNVVVEHTGYPEDFIGFDQDLEAELGVDSVKQAEMMGDLRSKFEIPLDESFVLSEHPTLNHIAGYISRMSDVSESVPEVIPEKENVPEISLETTSMPQEKNSDDSQVRRWQVEVEEAESLTDDVLDINGKTILITDEDWNLGEYVAEELKSKGAKVILLSLDSSAKNYSLEDNNGTTLIRANPKLDGHLLEVATHVNSIGNLGGLIHLAPLDLAGLDWSSKNSEKQTIISTISLFNLLQELDSDFANLDSGIVVSVSAMDGRHGNRGSHFNSVAAGAHGLIKSYSKERENLICTALDVHPDLMSNTQELAKHIVRESLCKQELVEIGLDRDLRRWKLVLFDEALIDKRTELSNDVLIVSGGGSGVTAASCIALASSSRNSSSTFVLLGRTELISETSEWVNDDDEMIQQRKLELREQLIKEKGTVNMVEWENAWKPYARSIDINLTINAIESTGNYARYFSCDVNESKSLSKIGSLIGKDIGAITGIIHGAGIEDSKLIGDKDTEIFEKVVSIKTNGWINLFKAAEDSGTKDLRIACCFTSIAGRFGNAGQTDYSAANCILDAEMSRLNAIGNTRGIAIAWTGWREVGMATKGSIEKVFEQAGIQTVGLERGVQLFVDEFLRNGKRRVVIAGELGILDELGVKREPPLLIPAEITAIIEDQGKISLIDFISSFEEGQSLTVETTFDIDTYPFLEDHSIDGVPYLPGVMALELFAQCSRLLIPKSFVSGFNEVSFGLPVKLIRPEQKVRVIAKREGNNVKCIMESDLINSEGAVFGQPKQHHLATVCLSKTYQSSKKSEIGLPDPGELQFSSNFIYSRFFHGPRFQSHGGIISGVEIEGDLGADGIILQRHQLPNNKQFKLETENIDVKLESYPMLIESAFQNAGMVTMENSDMQALPIGISSSTLLRQPESNANLLIRTVCRQISEGVSIHDAVIIEDNKNKSVVMIIEGIKLKALAPLEESMRFEMER